MAEADLDQIAKLLGVAGSSAHDGEAVNAIRGVDRRLRAANMAWPDLITPFRQLEIATEAARVLLAEVERLRAENSRGGAAVAVWQEVGAKVTSASSAARWGLDLHQRGVVWLSSFEVNFLDTCSRWVGRLTPNQQPIFQRIIDQIVERTGQQPPL